MLAGIESSIEREVYAGRAAKMARVTPEAMAVEDAASWASSASGEEPRKSARSARRAGLAQPKDRTLAYSDMKSARAEENVLRLLFTDQKLINGIEKQLPAAWFSAPVLRKIYERVLELDRSGGLVDVLKALRDSWSRAR